MKLLASDLDGTLYIDSTITKEDINAIKAFRDAGNKFIICTGRSINQTFDELTKFEIDFDYIIGVNGALAVDKNLKIVYQNHLDKRITLKIQNILKNHDINQYHLSNGIDFNIIDGSKDLDVLKIDYEQIKGYYIDVKSSDNALKLAEELEIELSELGIKAYVNQNFVAIGMTGINKGTGILKLIDEINFKGDVFTIGDDYNDIPMLTRFESFGIATGFEGAIKHAKTIVNSVSEAIVIINKNI